ncbi:MAG TPA: hypothetical protein VN612_10565 [Acidobacteriaceae bacterium]|nr:hypothetical protein [Acidobacteriaceae bacterium]
MKAFTLPVAHVNYRVVFQKSVKHNGRAVHGLCDVTKRVIRVEIKDNMELIRQIIWHEFLHALFYEIDQIIDGENESVTDTVATAIMRVRVECSWL